jgi:hypothetical protein
MQTITQHLKKKHDCLTAPKRNWRFSASYASFVVKKTFVLRMNICGKNRQLLVAAKRRYDQVQNRLKVSRLATESPFPYLTVLY